MDKFPLHYNLRLSSGTGGTGSGGVGRAEALAGRPGIPLNFSQDILGSELNFPTLFAALEFKNRQKREREGGAGVLAGKSGKSVGYQC